MQARRQLRQVQRLRLLTLAFVTVVLLGALPGFFFIKHITRDPGFVAMDELELPTWAARHPTDTALGNRWCVRTCRIRHRVWESDREIAATVEAYHRALKDQGWKRWHVKGCPPRPVAGDYSCWRRDEHTLDLWVRVPDCRKGRNPADDGERCPRSLVTVVVRNAGADIRLS